jgi:hypothetical protein
MVRLLIGEIVGHTIHMRLKKALEPIENFAQLLASRTQIGTSLEPVHLWRANAHDAGHACLDLTKPLLCLGSDAQDLKRKWRAPA